MTAKKPRSPNRERRLNKLTDGDLRHLIAQGKAATLSDGGGLTFGLTKEGTATFFLRYALDGRRRELTLGRYPDLSLAEARKKATKARGRVADGEDVATTKQRAKTRAVSSWTVRELYRDFETKVVPTLAGTTAKSMTGYMENGVLPKIGAMKVHDVTLDDARTVVDRAGKRSYWAGYNARKAGQMLFRYAEDLRFITINPFSLIKMRTVGAKPAVRQRVALNDSELRPFLTHLDRLSEVDALLAQVLVYTGVRIGEALNAEWVDIRFNDGVWWMPREKCKTRKYMTNDHHAIVLTPTLCNVFLRLRELADGSPWVFPTISPRKQPQMDHEAALARFKSYADSLGEDFPDIVFHDTRSTVITGLERLDFRETICKRAVNHKVPGVHGIYSQADWEEIANAQRVWQLHLDTVRTTPPAKNSGNNVVPLRRRAA